MSCCNCSFISLSDFVGQVVIDENIPEDYITPSIQLTQLTFIKPLLCKDLYEDLCSEIESGNISQAYQDLLCKIKPVHVRYAFSDFIYKHPVKVTRESVVRKVADESEFVPFDNIRELSKQYRLDAETYAAELIQFLEDNIADYPLWESGDCNDCKQDDNVNGGFF